MNLCNGKIESHHLILQHEELLSSTLPVELGQRTLKDIVAETEKRSLLMH